MTTNFVFDPFGPSKYRLAFGWNKLTEDKIIFKEEKDWVGNVLLAF